MYTYCSLFPDVSRRNPEIVPYFARFRIAQGESHARIVVPGNAKSEPCTGVAVDYREVVSESEYLADKVGGSAG